MTATNVQNALQAANNSLQKVLTQRSAHPNKLGKDEFMKLLMAQVTHQDPLNPMDSKGMMQQLTSMGSLEQLVNLNKAVKQLHQTETDAMRANTFAFLDKDVTIRGGGVSVSGGQAPGLRYALPRQAQAVTVSIANANGVPVRDLKVGGQGAGAHSVDWDGTDNQGKPVPDGYYHYSVRALGQNQEPIPAETFVRGKVSGVRFENGRPKLTVNGEDIDVGDVIQMSNRSQRLFGDQAPAALRQDLRTGPPVTRRRP